MKQYNILFLCTHNSARSVLGEALASTHQSGLFVGYSAGSTPGTSVNPIAAELTKEMGYDQSKLRSKSWDEYGLPDAPKMDFIVTVCDNAAGEVIASINVAADRHIAQCTHTGDIGLSRSGQ